MHAGWGKAAFWLSMLGFYVVFMPLYVVGMLGMTRRLQHYDVVHWRPWLLVAAAGIVVRMHRVPVERLLTFTTEALDIARSAGDRHAEARGFERLGMTSAMGGFDWRQADDAFAKGLAIEVTQADVKPSFVRAVPPFNLAAGTLARLFVLGFDWTRTAADGAAFAGFVRFVRQSGARQPTSGLPVPMLTDSPWRPSGAVSRAV